MAGGQALDLQAETEAPDEQGIIDLQAMKTGALIRYACEAGALVAGAADVDCRRMARFGEIIGLAFQLRDDLLDLTAAADVMGKATGKDAARGKATLVSARGADWSRRRLQDLVEEASGLLKPYGEKADMLLALARYVATREN
jgi:farnesyl diphosphate synthase